MAEEDQVTTPVDEREDVDHSEFTSDSNECPECGEPVDNIRKTCIKCGREYDKDDYDDTEAGNELRAGTGLDEEGNEILDEDASEEGSGEESDEGDSDEEEQAR